MARWPSILASGLLAVPAALPARPGDMPRIEAARVVEAALTCRSAPLDFTAAREHARQQGFGDLPADVRARMPFTTFTRRDVRLILVPTTMIPGSCKVYGEVREESRFRDIVAQLSSVLGSAPVTAEENRAGWWFDDRTVHASLEGGALGINVIFQRLDRSEMLGARPAQPPPRTVPGPPVAMRPTAPAAEIAAAAAACMAALGDKGIDSAAMGRAGWPLADTVGEARIHSRDGSNVRAVTTAMGGGQCIVDAYGERAEGFEAIRDAIRTRLSERFGSAVRLGASVGGEGGFSRGQGFRVGKRIGVLSSERREDGLSIRFSVMKLR